MAQLQHMVTQTAESLALGSNTNRGTETVNLPQADAAAVSSFIVEVDWPSLTPAILETLLPQSLLASSERTLLLPIFNSSILATGTTPSEYTTKIIQRLQVIEALMGSNAIPVLLAPTYSPLLASTRLVASLLKQTGHASFIGVIESIRGDDPTLGVEAGDNKEPQLTIRLVERWAPMMVAILAAGKSSRMGRSKQLEPIDGVPMVVKAITTAIQSGADSVHLVTGAYADEINMMLQERMLANHPALRIIHNPHFADGQSTSVRAVANYLLNENEIGSQSNRANTSSAVDAKRFSPPVAAIIFMPVDQPYLSTLLLKRLHRLWQRGIQIAAPSVNTIPRGAPALFDYEFWPSLSDLSGDVGAKVMLRRFSEQLHTIEVAEKQLLDIDTPADIP